MSVTQRARVGTVGRGAIYSAKVRTAPRGAAAPLLREWRRGPPHSSAEALLATRGAGPPRHQAQQAFLARSGEGLLGAPCARGELELAPLSDCMVLEVMRQRAKRAEATRAIYVAHKPNLKLRALRVLTSLAELF